MPDVKRRAIMDWFGEESVDEGLEAVLASDYDALQERVKSLEKELEQRTEKLNLATSVYATLKQRDEQIDALSKNIHKLNESVQREHNLYLEATKAGTPYAKERDAMNGLVLEVERLRKELAKFQESEFHPNWSMLEAARESIRDHQGMLKNIMSAVDVACKRLRDMWQWSYDIERGAIDEVQVIVSQLEKSVLESERNRPEPESERLLKNLLAVIHRDGGHYVVNHGLNRATDDAQKISSERIGCCEELRKALRDASDELRGASYNIDWKSVSKAQQIIDNAIAIAKKDGEA